MHDHTRTIDNTQAESGNFLFLTPRDLQAELQIGEKLCYRLLQSGVIPSFRVGNLIRIYRPHLKGALLEEPGPGKEKAEPGSSAKSLTPGAMEVKNDCTR
jgi:hypothetical protein